MLGTIGPPVTGCLPRDGCIMLEDDLPYPAEQIRAQWRDDLGWPTDPHGFLGAPVDESYATARAQSYLEGYEYRLEDLEGYAQGYAPYGEGHETGFPEGREASPDEHERHGARHGKPRRSTGNVGLLAGGAGAGAVAERVAAGWRRAGVAALTATAVVGTGTTATVFSFVPVTPPPVPVTPAAAITPP